MNDERPELPPPGPAGDPLAPLGPLAPAIRELIALVRGRSDPLLPFQEIQKQLRLTHMIDRGIHEVPVASITGSLGRTRDFDRAFLPRDDHRRRRLAELRVQAERGGFPPIDLYRVGDVYFVVDGHHRVALARQMELAQIEAHVWEFPTDVAVGPDDDIAEVVARASRRNFQRATGLDDATVDELAPSDPAGFARLLEHIAGHRYYLGLERGQEPAWSDAVASWLERVYRPVVAVVVERQLLADLPGRTASDLYLWVSEHLHRLRRAYGDDTLAPEAVVPEPPRWRRWLTRLRRS
jgi:hypothetical protein